MATIEVMLIRCNGPGGVVEVVVNADDVTGAVLGFRIRGARRALLKIFENGIRKLATFDGTVQTSTARLGYIYDKDNPKKSVLPVLELSS